MISPFPYCLREGQGKVKKKSEDAKNEKQKKGMFSHVLFHILSLFPYFTVSTIALKASGWFIARSARVFLFSVIPFLSSLPINSE